MTGVEGRPEDPPSEPSSDENESGAADVAADPFPTAGTAPSSPAEAHGTPSLPAPAVAEPQRQEWHEGGDEDAPPESWLSLDDDDLLHRIETASGEDDDRLVEVVESDRHFFVRQEAAKQVRDRALLFRFEDDRYIAPILVRHLTRREDVTYLERLVERSHHVEVRAAAQVQLAKLWGCLGGPSRSALAGGPALPPPEFRERASSPSAEGRAQGDSRGRARAAEDAEEEGVDASLLGWALHFIVEEGWEHLGTTGARGLLRRTHAELLPANESLHAFRVEDDAHVGVDLGRGARLPRESIGAVARWVVAFLAAASRAADASFHVDVRAATCLMGDALERVGFYDAVDAAWSARR